MLNTALAFIALILYVAAAAVPASRLFGRTARREPLYALGSLGIVVHALVLFGSQGLTDGLYLEFFSAASIMGWFMAVATLIAAPRQPVDNLALIVLPLAGVTAVLGTLLGSARAGLEPLPHGIGLHVYTSVIAYSVLALAALQALLLAYQDYQLRHKHLSTIMRFLPPLQVMEGLLFRILVLGFGLLSLSLLTGALFLKDMFAQHLVHKTVLSIVAWCLFATLLLGHWRLGWRARTAMYWTLGGFLALMLAYFGSKLVLEFILDRL